MIKHLPEIKRVIDKMEQDNRDNLFIGTTKDKALLTTPINGIKFWGNGHGFRTRSKLLVIAPFSYLFRGWFEI